MGIVHYRTCEHCGKRLDEMHDYVDWEVSLKTRFLSVDICCDCMEELENLVLGFVKRRAV